MKSESLNLQMDLQALSDEAVMPRKGKGIQGGKGNEKKDCIIRCTCFPVLNVYTGSL